MVKQWNETCGKTPRSKTHMSEENTQSTYIGGEGKRSIDRRHPRACTNPHWSGGSRQTTDMARKITPIPVAVKKQGKDQRRWKLSHNHRWGSRGRDAAENKKKMECNHQHSRKQQEKKKERKINMPKSMVGRRLTTHTQPIGALIIVGETSTQKQKSWTTAIVQLAGEKC